MAEQHRLRTYDAVYLELAKRTGLPLATLDGDLLKAARAEGVAMVEDDNFRALFDRDLPRLEAPVRRLQN